MRFDVDRHYKDDLYLVYYLLSRVLAYCVRLDLPKDIYDRVEKVMLKIDIGNFT